MAQKKKKNQKKGSSSSKKPSQGKKRGFSSKKTASVASKRYLLPLIILVAVIALLVAAFYSDRFSQWRAEQIREADSDKIAAIIDKLPPPAIDTIKPDISLPPAHRIAIVIDDMGQGTQTVKDLIGISTGVTISILPFLSHSAEVAELAHLSGLEVLLHVPMEPRNMKVHNPGDGMLHTSMSKDELVEVLIEDIAQIPYITGMNNHMGSKFTEDRILMKVVLEEAKKRGLYFFDSVTTGASVAASTAVSLGVKNASRNIFLDNERSEEYISGQLEQLIKIAKTRGSAIAIGHPYPETIAVLKRVLPEIEKRGVRVVSLSELIK